MEVKEVYIPRKSPQNIFSIIEKQLEENIDTQVYIEDEIFQMLFYDGNQFYVSNPNYSKSFHYNHNDDYFFSGDLWLELLDTDTNEYVARGSFISNCRGYMQLVEFKSNKIKKYTHYLVGIKEILMIGLEENKEDAK